MGTISGAAILGAGIWSLLGLPDWVLLGLVAVPWIALLYPRWGGRLTVIATIVGELLGILGVLMLSAATNTPLLAAAVTVLSVVGLVGSGLLAVSSNPIRLPSRAAIALWLPACAGGLVWGAVQVAALFVPGAARISWVMRGDSANNILLLRDVLHSNGIRLGPESNPVPLPTALVALVSASGRGATPPVDLLAHDLAAMALVWSSLIALGALAAGLTVGTIVREAGARTVVVALAAGGGSLFSLSWYVTGNAVDFGFLDAQLALPLVLFAFVCYLGAERRAPVVLSCLCMIATLLLTVWSPLVLIPASLGLVIVLRHWRAIVAARGFALVVLVVAALQLLVYGLGVAVPNLLRLGALLTAAGAVFQYHHWLIVLLALVVCAFGFASFRSVWHPVTLGVISVVAAAAVGLGILLLASRNQPSPWTYYPEKFAWLCSTVILVLGIALALGAATVRLRSPGIQLVALLAVGACTGGFLMWIPTSDPNYGATNPALRVLAGQSLGPGDVVAHRILRLSDPQQSAVLWHTSDPFESVVNFWTWQMWAGSLNANPALRRAAYNDSVPRGVGELCRIVVLLGNHSIVYTAQSGLQAKLHSQCPGIHAKVVLERKN